MKLYATVTSERDSRPAKKGGDEFIIIQLHHRNALAFGIQLTGDMVDVYKYGNRRIRTFNGDEYTQAKT